MSFEILEPATVVFPESVSQIVIMNRSPVSLDLFQEEDVRNLTRDQLLIVDTLISASIFRGLNEVLSTSEIKTFKNPLWISRRRSDTTGLNIPLTKREVNNIMMEYDCDAIISMEYYNLDVGEFMEYSSELEILGMYYVTTNRIKWAVYLINHPRPFDEYTTRDTLYFQYYSNGNFLEPISSVEIIRQTAMESGRSFGNYLIPTWTPITRILYKGKEKELKETNRYTDAGKWDKAYESWNRLLVGADSVVAAKAAYNMAVYHELEDDLTGAIKFVKLSEALNFTELAESFKEDLEIRLLNKQQIIEQLGH
ncbi:MAG: hypothetical protein JXA39_06300 [Bacteroidales bacterium]|nr:hypothetical protein [Bacteroidales bacterium]